MTDTSPRATAEQLYTAFARRDGAGMAACYAPDATFSDPAFPGLRGPEVGGMWRMLCQRGKDLRIAWRILDVQGDTVRVHWDAWYTFSATGRKVHNSIESELKVHGGLVVAQTDTFDFWRWSRQALGPVGALLGWSGFLRGKVQGQARAGLRAFLADNPPSSGKVVGPAA